MFNYKAIWELKQEYQMLKDRTDEMCERDTSWSWCLEAKK